MSEAYASTLHISFDVRGGLLMRQIHHWAALLFVAAIDRAPVPGVLHRRVPQAARAELGHRRRPHHRWASSRASPATRCPTTCCPAPACASPTGIILSIPVVGTYLSFFVFGGEFPGDDYHPPAVHRARAAAARRSSSALITAHLMLIWYQKHTQYPGPGRTEHNVVGYPLLPGLHGQGRRLLLHRLRRHRRCWARSPRSTRSGCTGRTPRPRSPPARSPTGTWAGWRARCA